MMQAFKHLIRFIASPFHSTVRFAVFVFGLTALISLASVHGQAVLRVDIDNDIPFSQQDGGSWSTAYRFLQDALDEAEVQLGNPQINEVDIWVAQGTYRPDQGENYTLGDRTASFELRNHVAIYGGFFGDEEPHEFDQRDWELNPTILDGDLDDDDDFEAQYDNGVFTGLLFGNYDDNSFHVVTAVANALLVGPDVGLTCSGCIPTTEECECDGCSSRCRCCPRICVGCPETPGCGEVPINATAVLDGFTIRGGNADGSGSGPAASGDGAGLRIVYSSPTIRNCVIRENKAPAQSGHEGESFSGGGVFANGPFPERMTFDNVTIRHDFSHNTGGGLYTLADCVGDGTMLWSALSLDIAILQSEISENIAAGGNGGGGIASIGAGSEGDGLRLQISIVNSELHGNRAEAWGSAIHVDSLTTLRVWNSLISGNQADNPDAPIAAISAGADSLGGDVVLDVINSTIVNNVGGDNGGGIRSQGTATVRNSIIWDNSPGQINGNLNGVTVEYSIVEGGWSGSTNSGDDPEFANPNSGNYRLLVSSPAADAGFNDHLPCDEYDIAPGVAGLEAAACEGVGEADGERHPIDLDVRERVRLGELGTVDIGAYEL